jgi:hypothetical protein
MTMSAKPAPTPTTIPAVSDSVTSIRAEPPFHTMSTVRILVHLAQTRDRGSRHTSQHSCGEEEIKWNSEESVPNRIATAHYPILGDEEYGRGQNTSNTRSNGPSSKDCLS